jgi:hypothetical protein
MNATISRSCVAAFFATAFCVTANAEYRCAPAQSPLDQRACAAAEQGPDALRRFVERWDNKMSSLYFSDYVDVKTAKSWDARGRDLASKASNEREQVASSERR